jgi:hypothetical protein
MDTANATWPAIPRLHLYSLPHNTEVTGHLQLQGWYSTEHFQVCASFALYQVDYLRPTSEPPRCTRIGCRARNCAQASMTVSAHSVSHRRVRSMRGHGKAGQPPRWPRSTLPLGAFVFALSQQGKRPRPRPCRYDKPQPAKRRVPNP